MNDEESEEPGEFQRASAEVLSQRRRVTVRRSAGSSLAPMETPAAAASANPFSSLTGFAAAASTPSITSGLAKNPFQGFSGLSTPAPAPAAAPAPMSTLISTPAPVSSSAPISEHKRKLTKLNQTFVTWLEKQSVENALSIWKDGMKVGQRPDI